MLSSAVNVLSDVVENWIRFAAVAVILDWLAAR
jgi:hypothetical protein